MNKLLLLITGFITGTIVTNLARSNKLFKRGTPTEEWEPLVDPALVQEIPPVKVRKQKRIPPLTPPKPGAIIQIVEGARPPKDTREKVRKPHENIKPSLGRYC